MKYNITIQSLIDNEYFRKISSDALKVILILLSHSGQNLQAVYPSIKRIEQMTGMSEYKVLTALKVLVEHELITVQKSGKKNIYHFTKKIYDFSTNLHENQEKMEISEKKVENYQKKSPKKLKKPKLFGSNKTESSQTKFSYINNNNLNKNISTTVVVNDNVINKLVEFGIPYKTAISLMQNYPDSNYETIIHVASKKNANIKNVCGWIRKAIEENWQFPEADKEIAKSKTVNNETSNTTSKSEAISKENEKINNKAYYNSMDIYNTLDENKKREIDRIVSDNICKIYGEDRINHKLVRQGILQDVILELYG